MLLSISIGRVGCPSFVVEFHLLPNLVSLYVSHILFLLLHSYCESLFSVIFIVISWQSEVWMYATESD